MFKTCQICGKIFEPNHPAQLVCSDECRRKKKTRLYQERNGTPDIIFCKQCGRQIPNAKRRTRLYCDECNAQRQREHFADLHKRYRPHKSRAAYCKKYYQTHRDKILARRKIYRAANRHVISLKRRERYRLNPEPRKQSAKLYYQKHKDRINRRRYIILKLKQIDAGIKTYPFCMHCGKMFKPAYKGEKYCSESCRRQSPLYRVWCRIKSRLNY